LTINQTKDHWFDSKNKPKLKPETKTNQTWKKYKNSKIICQNESKPIKNKEYEEHQWTFKQNPKTQISMEVVLPFNHVRKSRW
jgi:hypothetical protein